MILNYNFEDLIIYRIKKKLNCPVEDNNVLEYAFRKASEEQCAGEAQKKRPIVDQILGADTLTQLQGASTDNPIKFAIDTDEGDEKGKPIQRTFNITGLENMVDTDGSISGFTLKTDEKFVEYDPDSGVPQMITSQVLIKMSGIHSSDATANVSGLHRLTAIGTQNQFKDSSERSSGQSDEEVTKESNRKRIEWNKDGKKVTYRSMSGVDNETLHKHRKIKESGVTSETLSSISALADETDEDGNSITPENLKKKTLELLAVHEVGEENYQDLVDYMYLREIAQDRARLQTSNNRSIVGRDHSQVSGMDSDKFDNSYKGRYLAQQLGYTMSNIERFSKLGEVDGDPPDLRRGVVEDLAEIYGSDSDSITDIESEQSQIGKRIFKAIAPSLEGLGGERTKSSQKLMTMSAKNGEKVMEHLKKALESKSLTQEDIDSYLGTIASQEYVALASRNMMKLATGEGRSVVEIGSSNKEGHHKNRQVNQSIGDNTLSRSFVNEVQRIYRRKRGQNPKEVEPIENLNTTRWLGSATASVHSPSNIVEEGKVQHWHNHGGIERDLILQEGSQSWTRLATRINAGRFQSGQFEQFTNEDGEQISVVDQVLSFGSTETGRRRTNVWANAGAVYAEDPTSYNSKEETKKRDERGVTRGKTIEGEYKEE